jgi:tetratricopeptide (TPR) repeat protein
MTRALYASFIENDTAAGLAAGTELTELHPESGRARLVLAGLQAAATDNEAARATVAEILVREPDYLGAHSFLANSYLFNEPKDLDKAEHHMARITELRPDAASAWVGLGDARRAMVKLDAARADYSKALTIQPGHPLAAVKRGHVNSFLGSFEAARADYDAGIETASTTNRPGLANYRAFVHLHAGQHDRAIEELEALLIQVENMDMSVGDKRAARIFALQNISNIAFYAKQPDVARSAVARMSETYAAQAESVDAASARGQKAAALYWRGKLAAHLGDFATAEALAAEYLKVRKPDKNPRKTENYHEILGIVSLGKKDYDAAVGHLQQSNLQAGDILTRYHLAEALEGAGSVEEARALFGEVADWSFNSVGYALLRGKARTRAGGG